MKRRHYRLRLLLLVLTLLLIWGQSVLPASQSAQESGWFLSLVRPAVTAVQALLARAGVVMDASVLVRKIAHFAEYALLGLLAYLLFSALRRRGRLPRAGVVCLAAALIDEAIQRFSAGRGPSLRDVALDFCGALTGILLAALLTVLRPSSRPTRKKQKKLRF